MVKHPAPHPGQPGAALLAAAWHLLAWAKTRWTELARDGPSERLAFLWFWGHRHGLARLV